MSEIILPSDSFHLEKTPDGQWITKFSDGSWYLSFDTEIAMWNIITTYETRADEIMEVSD